MNDLNEFLKRVSEQFEVFAGDLIREIRDNVPAPEKAREAAPEPESLRDPVTVFADSAPAGECLKDLGRVAAAMVEAGVEEETIIRMLQKYWDLRRSEALPLVACAREQVGKERARSGK